MPRQREITSTFQEQQHGSYHWSATLDDHETWVARDKDRYYSEKAMTVAHSEVRPDTATAALMQCAPGQEPLPSLEELSPLRDILADAVDALTERERWVIEAWLIERLSMAAIGTQLSLSAPSVHRIKTEALTKLRGLLQDNSTVQEYLA